MIINLHALGCAVSEGRPNQNLARKYSRQRSPGEGKMRKAVLYARVSSKDQEREGYSIPAQLKLLREYAQKHSLEIAREFVDVETAKTAGRKEFGEMLSFLRQNPDSGTLLVEKTDRLYRNFRDFVTLEDLNVEIHLVKEGQIIGKDSKSQARMVHGIQVAIARGFIDNLREEVRKGMREKAEQGIYPSRPPIGYRNNKLQRTIEIDAEKAPAVRRMFELYATGDYSLLSLGRRVSEETGLRHPKSYLERILKNPFYIGLFEWDHKIYRGTHTPLIRADLFERVREIFQGRNKPKYRSHEFAYSGLLKCAYDNCTVTAELKRGRYTYYHCTGYRGKCGLPYFREEALGDRLGQVLCDIHIPDEVLGPLEKAFMQDRDRGEERKQAERTRLEHRLSGVRRRLDQIYLDKLDGKISEDFWLRKTQQWQQEEQQILVAMKALEEATPDRSLNAVRILELANKAYSLYLRQNHTERGKLLRIVLSNCLIDSVSIYPTYRKPFDLILGAAKTGEWYARGDSNTRPLAS
jgi:site-specific DNA recombinase